MNQRSSGDQSCMRASIHWNVLLQLWGEKKGAAGAAPAGAGAGGGGVGVWGRG